MILDILKSIVLGIVQGITEFFPVSSSGHLVIVPYILKWDFIPLYHTVLLHFATLLALVTVFYRDIGRIIKYFFAGLFLRTARKSNYFKLSLLIIIASVPAAIAGFFLEKYVEDFFSRPLYVAIFLLVTAAFLFTGEFVGKKIEKNNIKKSVGFKNALIIGIGQALAIFPGISRSGSTISFARIFGIERAEAVRFSFLLSIPVILGAFILSIGNIYSSLFAQEKSMIAGAAAGFIFSYLSGVFAIKFLLRFSRNKNLNIFAIYCAAIAIAMFIIIAIRGL